MNALPPVNDIRSKEANAGIAIPPQPQLLCDIEQAYPDIDKVSGLIARDPLISQGVLRVVNSPSIGLSRQISKLQQAVILLGLDAVMNIVNSVLLETTLSQQIDQKLLANYWRNTKATAAASGLLATKISTVRPDDAYVLGLFHNCAIPLMLEKYGNYLDIVTDSYQHKTDPVTKIEDEQFKANHAIIGHYIARAWNLPKTIVYAVRDHHSHQRLMCQGKDEFEQYVDSLCAILKLAEHITKTHSDIGKTSQDKEWAIYKKPILKQLGVPAELLLEIVNEVLSHTKNINY